MISTFIGFLAVFGGLTGVYTYRSEFFTVLKGLFPICLFVGGVIAVIIGISSLRSTEGGKSAGSKKEK